MLNRAYIKHLPRIFGGPVLTELADRGRSRAMLGILRESGIRASLRSDATNGEAFEAAYAAMLEQYRGEYIFKNVVAEQILLARHSLSEATLLCELRAGMAKADVVILNGTSTVYEIKTDQDSIDRLASQLTWYRQIFDRIEVVSGPQHVKRLTEFLPDDVGLLVLTPELEIQRVCEGESHCAALDPATMFDTLRRDEYVSAIISCYGSAPDVPSSLMYQACREMFVNLSPGVAHERFVAALRRRQSPGLAELVHRAPPSLRVACLATDLSARRRSRLATTFAEPLAA